MKKTEIMIFPIICGVKKQKPQVFGVLK